MFISILPFQSIMGKLRVGIVGASGAAGLEFVKAFNGHPDFVVEGLFASERSAGKTLEERCLEKGFDHSFIPDSTKNSIIFNINKISQDMDLICSALPSDEAKNIEGECAQHTPVISTASAFRYENDAPIFITEINTNHYRLLKQQANRGWNGWVLPGPNCTTVGLVISVFPIYKELGVKRILMMSYQSVSGGGAGLISRWTNQKSAQLPQHERYTEKPVETPPIVIEGNVIGYIKNEEPKVKRESIKILGDYKNGKIYPAPFKIDCTCVRVPTLVGHFEVVYAETEKSFSIGSIKEIFHEYNSIFEKQFGRLHSSPKEVGTYVVLDRSPQPLFDAYLGEGMSTVIGRIEKTDIFGNNKGVKFEVLSNNLEKGAAKGIVQGAEYLKEIGFLRSK